MFSKILGVLWCGIGIFWFIRPQSLRNWLKVKSLKKTRKWLFLILLSGGIYFISMTLKLKGIIAKVILILGIIVIIKGFLFLKYKTASKLIDFYTALPLRALRVFALIFTFVGLFIFFLK